MRRTLFAAGVLAVVAVPVPAHAWGYDAHKFIVEQAIRLLPAELRPLFEAHRQIVIERSIDPDTWRAMFEAEEAPHHYLDLDSEGYGPYPFEGLPRDLDEAIRKFGHARVSKNGTLPWRTEEMHGRLREAFTAYERRGSFGRYDILFYAAWMAHYVSDGHVPHHAVVDSDGERTGQAGIHVRFESLLFDRYRHRLQIQAPPLAPIRTPRDFMFGVLLQSTTLVPLVLEADRRAIGARDVYDEAYYEAFFAAGRGVLERRLGESSAAVAAMIAGAWEAAGKPPLPVRAQDPEQRRRP